MKLTVYNTFIILSCPLQAFLNLIIKVKKNGELHPIATFFFCWFVSVKPWRWQCSVIRQTARNNHHWSKQNEENGFGQNCFGPHGVHSGFLSRTNLLNEEALNNRGFTILLLSFIILPLQYCTFSTRCH